ncbi:MAG TPA: ribose ABC transporter permease [bacterium]|nr:ribose ABC transporter permease [Candidatus Omnitrophota bacterium]HOJ60992.1 ribose ABC transporter permease [bacterium]HOL95790.1 ribose ABC transporter permease [bacterium]HPP02975.1 ribose ABC transporter permease [bacterium]HXK95003.1 ribose ABC transporter permease [bacterium]
MGDAIRFLRFVSRLFKRNGGPLAGLIVLCLLLSIATPHFFTSSNLTNVAQQASVNAIVSIGMTFVILTAGIDLSVGSVLALVGVVLASLLRAGLPMPLAVGIALAGGFGCGTVNGVLVCWGRLPPFIVTLGMMSMARGGALVYTGGRPISGFEEPFRHLAQGTWFGLPIPVWIMIGLYGAAHTLLSRTSLGRYTYAIGGNETAVRLSGVNVHVYKTLIYGLSGFTTAAAAVLLTARLNSASPLAGINYELDAIAATVIGGTSLMGGEGHIMGTLIGAFIIQVLRNGLNLLNITSNFQNIVIGAVIVAAALLDTYLKSRRKS